MQRKLGGPRLRPRIRLALGDRAGHGRRLVCAAWALRQASDVRTCLRPPSPMRATAFPVTQYISALWRANMVSLSSSPDVEEFENAAEDLSHQRRAAGSGTGLQESRSRARAIRRWRKAGAMRSTRARSPARWTAYFRRIGGDLRYVDFAEHRGEWVDPISVNYRGYDVYELPPNSQGGAALQMLKILEGYNLKAMGPGLGRRAPSHDRGQAARLRGSRQILRRPGLREDADDASCFRTPTPSSAAR